jgi:hypothetical protein
MLRSRQIKLRKINLLRATCCVAATAAEQPVKAGVKPFKSTCFKGMHQPPDGWPGAA